jgi:hypothetical protein
MYLDQGSISTNSLFLCNPSFFSLAVAKSRIIRLVAV